MGKLDTVVAINADANPVGESSPSTSETQDANSGSVFCSLRFSSESVEKELKDLVQKHWQNFRHDGVMSIINDSGELVLAPSAAKAFCDQVVSRTQILSYLPEDVQAIQSYCQADFLDEHSFPVANNHLGVVVGCQSVKQQWNSGIVVQASPAVDRLNQNSEQEISRDPNHQQVCDLSPCHHLEARESLSKIQAMVEEIHNHLLGRGSEHGLCNRYTNIDLSDPSSEERRMNQRKTTSEEALCRRETDLESKVRASSSSYGSVATNDQDQPDAASVVPTSDESSSAAPVERYVRPIAISAEQDMQLSISDSSGVVFALGGDNVTIRYSADDLHKALELIADAKAYLDNWMTGELVDTTLLSQEIVTEDISPSLRGLVTIVPLDSDKSEQLDHEMQLVVDQISVCLP